MSDNVYIKHIRRENGNLVNTKTRNTCQESTISCQLILVGTN